MFLSHYKHLLTIKLLFLFIGGIGFFIYQRQDTLPNKAPPLIFALQLTESMDTQDIQQGTTSISRIQAAQTVITDTLANIHTHQPIGIIGYNESTRSYLIPPTTDHDFIHQRLPLYHSQTYLGRVKEISFEEFLTDAHLIILSYDTSGKEINIPHIIDTTHPSSTKNNIALRASILIAIGL